MLCILCFVDRASLYNLVNKADLVHNFFSIFISLHVSGDYVEIIRRNNCLYATIGTCYSVWITVCYSGRNSFHPEYPPYDVHIVARNM